MADTDDYGPRLNITIWSLTGTAALFLGLRIYCKVWRGRPVRSEDAVLVASWVLTPLEDFCSICAATNA